MNNKRFSLRALAFGIGLALASGQLAPALASTPPPITHNGGSAAGLNLDLSSTSASISASKALIGSVINLGGSTQTIHAGQMLTPAELVAALETVTGGKQTLSLSDSGAAVGGTLTLTSALGNLSAMLLPRNVTAIDNTRDQSQLTVAGALIDSGTVLGIGSAGSTFKIDAGSLNVGGTGAISTAHGVNLSIFSAGDVTNAGSISSGGNLSLNAGGTVTNNAGATITGATGTTLFAGSGQINNAGTITAQAGTLTLTTADNTPLVINNTSGVLQATAGAINLRDADSHTTQATQLTEGNVLSDNLNVYGGTGKVNVDANDISGIVNVNAGSAQVLANDTPNLQIGVMNISGDPLIVNASPGGNVTITQNLVFPGQPLTIIAEQNIQFGSAVTTLSTASTKDNGGAITLLAGLDYIGGTSSPVDVPATIIGPDSFGGSILAATPPPNGIPTLVNITSGSTKAGASGGAVLLIANKGSVAHTGDIEVGSINTSAPGGTGGNVTIDGQGTVAVITVFDTGVKTGINTSGKNGGGSILIAACPVAISTTPAPQYDGVSGALIGGSLTPNTSVNPVAKSSFGLFGGIDTHATAGNGGAVTVYTDGLIEVLAAGVTPSADPFGGGPAAPLSTINGTAINATGSGVGNSGGTINLISISDSAAVGGSINIAAPQNSTASVMLAGSAIAGVAVLGNIIANSTGSGTHGATVTLVGGSTTTVTGSINASGTATGNDISLTTITAGAITVGGAITDTGKNNKGISIQLDNALGNVSVGAINGSATTGDGAVVSLTGPTGVTAGGNINTSAPASGKGNLAGGNVTITSTGAGITVLGSINSSGIDDGSTNVMLTSKTGAEVAGGIVATGSEEAGTVTVTATTSGDVRIGFNAVDNNAPGTTPILLDTKGGINVSSTKGVAGQVTLTSTAGNVYVAQGINASGESSGFDSGNITVSAGERLLIQGPINSNSTKATAGTISLTSLGTTTGNLLFGMDTGAISASGPIDGGSVSLTSGNGPLLVRGAIVTSSTEGQAGSITIYSQYDATIQGNVTAEGAANAGGLSGLMVDLYAGSYPHSNTTAVGILTVDGTINASSTPLAAAGTVFLFGQTGITVNGSVLATGQSGGSITTNSNDGICTITGNVNASSDNQTDPGAAGAVTLNSFGIPSTGAATIVGGNIIAKGGNATGKNAANGGAGGQVDISTAYNQTAGNTHKGAIGPIIVGSIDTQGGNTANLASVPGQGGGVELIANTIQLKDSSADGGSINTSSGTGGTGAPPNGGTVGIDTIGLQPIPSNFNLPSTTASVVALPGAMFTIGNDAVNGSAGKLISNVGTVSDVFTPQPLIGGPDFSPHGQILITTFLPTASFTLGISPNTEVISGVGPTIVHGKGVEYMVTPAAALALYQTTRGITQTMGLNAAFNASNLELSGAGANRITIQVPAEFSKQYSTFNLSTGPGQSSGSLTVTVSEGDNTPTVFLGVPSSGGNIAQTLKFTDTGGTTPAFVDVQIGKGALAVASDGIMQTTGNGQTINFFGSSAVDIVNNGVISADVLSFHSPNTINIQAGPGSNTTANVDFYASGSLGLASPAGSFNFLSTTPTGQSLPMLTTSANGQFLEKNIQIGATKGTDALPELNMIVSSVETFGTMNINGAGSIGGILIGSFGTIASVGPMTINVANTNFGSGTATPFLVTSLSSINMSASSQIGLIGYGSITANTNITLVSQGTVGDNSFQVSINAVSGNLIIGSSGLASNCGVAFTSAADKILSGGNMTIYGAGNAGVQTNGTITANGLLQLCGAPLLKVTNDGIDTLAGSLNGVKGVNITAGTDANITTTAHLNSASGSVTGTFTGSTVSIGGKINAQSVNLSSTADIAFTAGDDMQANAGNFTVTSAGRITFASNDFITVGSLTDVSNPSTTTPVLKSALQTTGSINISGALGVTFTADTFQQGGTLSTYGGNVEITSSEGVVVLGQQVGFQAIGGNVIILGQQGVAGGTTTATNPVIPGNYFTATALQSGSKFTGGGIEIRGGTQTSTVASVLSHIPSPFSNQIDPSQASDPVAFTTPAKGLIEIGSVAAVILQNDANTTNGAFVNGQNEVVIVTGTAAGIVFLDSAIFNSATPIGYVEKQSDSDEIIVDAQADNDEAL